MDSLFCSLTRHETYYIYILYMFTLHKSFNILPDPIDFKKSFTFWIQFKFYQFLTPNFVGRKYELESSQLILFETSCNIVRLGNNDYEFCKWKKNSSSMVFEKPAKKSLASQQRIISRYRTIYLILLLFCERIYYYFRFYLICIVISVNLNKWKIKWLITIG